MTNEEIREELERFKAEQDQIKQMVGQIGGIDDNKKDKAVNIVFAVMILILFTFDIFRNVFKLEVPLPPLVSIELGILLVSLKIIWMMHKQTKLEHFMFWILNSMEFRLNDVQKKINRIDKNSNGK